MTTKAKKQAVVFAAADDLMPDVGDMLTQEEMELAEFLNEIGPSATVIHIFRMHADGSRAQIAKVDFSVIREDVYEFLRGSYGAGKYNLVFKAGTLFKGSKVIRVELPTPTGAAPVAPAQDFLREQMARQDTFMLALLAAQKPPDLGASLGPLLAVLKPPPPPDPAAMLIALVGVFTQLKGASGDSGDWLQKVRDVAGIMKDLRTDTVPVEENLYTVVKDLGQKALDTFGSRMQAAGAPRQIPATLTPTGTTQANGGNGVTVPSTPVNGRTQQQTMRDWITVQLQYLKGKARAGKEAAFFVDYVLVNDDEPGCVAILSAIEGGATFDNLLAFDVEIAQTPELLAWFKTFYDELRAEVIPPVDTARDAGNAADVGNHAEPRADVRADSGTASPGLPAPKPADTGKVVA